MKQCMITGPNGRVPAQIVDSGSSISAKYTPTEIGEHLIDVSVGQRPIDGSPFRAAVFNPKAIRVTRVPNGVVGRPVEIDSKIQDPIAFTQRRIKT